MTNYTACPMGTVNVARANNYTPEQLARCFYGMTTDVASGLLSGRLEMDQDGVTFEPETKLPDTLWHLTLWVETYNDEIGRRVYDVPLSSTDNLRLAISWIRNFHFETRNAESTYDSMEETITHRYPAESARHIDYLWGLAQDRLKYSKRIPTGKIHAHNAWLTLKSAPFPA